MRSARKHKLVSCKFQAETPLAILNKVVSAATGKQYILFQLQDIYSVNDGNVTSVVYSLAAGGLVSSMVSLPFDAHSNTSACYIACIYNHATIKIYFAHLNNNSFLRVEGNRHIRC